MVPRPETSTEFPILPNTKHLYGMFRMLRMSILNPWTSPRKQKRRHHTRDLTGMHNSNNSCLLYKLISPLGHTNALQAGQWPFIGRKAIFLFYEFSIKFAAMFSAQVETTSAIRSLTCLHSFANGVT